MPSDAITMADIEAARQHLGDRIRTTPTWRWDGPKIRRRGPDRADIQLKLELFQHAGTFKPRGALLNILELSPEALERGITAVSAGNHAIAVAFAARQTGTHAKVVMVATANAARIEACRALGADVELSPDAHSAFQRVREIEADEGRAFIHPFEGRMTALGTATVGLELTQQCVDPLDAVVVPVGGGGLAAGVSAAIRLAWPDCEVFGVEPKGADSMRKSLAAGEPQSIASVQTKADSLGAPYAAPYSFSLCQRYLSEVVLVDDEEMFSAMGLLFEEMKLAVEPAAASATAAICGPLRERLQGKSVGLIVCGSNIDFKTLAGLMPYKESV